MKANEAANCFKVLGDENRLLIIKALCSEDEICACKFLDIVNCGQATLSHHLSVLSQIGLLKSKRDGKRILYSLNNELLSEIMNYLED